MAESFWNIPTSADVRTPVAILKEQAALLTNQTNGLLIGEVETLSIGSELVVVFSIRVPNLNLYKLEILSYSQPINMYPGILRFELRQHDNRSEIEDETQFIKAIKAYLSSPGMSRALQSLIAQAQQA